MKRFCKSCDIHCLQNEHYWCIGKQAYVAKYAQKMMYYSKHLGVLQRYSKKVPFLFAIIHNHIYAIHHNKQQMFNHFSWTDGSNEDNLNLQHYYALTHTHFPSCYVIICTPLFLKHQSFIPCVKFFKITYLKGYKCSLHLTYYPPHPKISFLSLYLR